MRTLVHLSDLHFGRVDDTLLEPLRSRIHALEPHLVVVSGDLTQRAKPGQFREAKAFLESLPTPQLVVPGNHDVPLFNVFQRILSPLGKYKRIVTRDLEPEFIDDEIAVIGLNTTRSFVWKDGSINSKQVEHVKSRICNLDEHIIKVVVTHHPFIPPPGERVHGIVHGARRALDQMEQCNIDMCLAGHLHMGYSGDVRTHHEAVKRSIISVQAGTATSTRRRGEPNAYNVITINPDHVTIQVRAWDGAKFDKAARTHFSRVDGIWIRED